MELGKSELIAKLEGVYHFVSDFAELQMGLEGSSESLNLAETALGECQEKFRSSRNTAIALFVLVIAAFVLDHFEITGIFSEWYGGLALGAAFIWSIVSAIKMVVYLIKAAFRKREVRRRGIDVEADDKNLADFLAGHAEQKKDADEMFPSGEYPFAKYIETGLNGVKSGSANTMEEALQLIEKHMQRDIAKAEAEAEAARKREAERRQFPPDVTSRSHPQAFVRTRPNNPKRCRECGGMFVPVNSEDYCNDCVPSQYEETNYTSVKCPMCGRKLYYNQNLIAHCDNCNINVGI